MYYPKLRYNLLLIAALVTICYGTLMLFLTVIALLAKFFSWMFFDSSGPSVFTFIASLFIGYFPVCGIALLFMYLNLRGVWYEIEASDALAKGEMEKARTLFLKAANWKWRRDDRSLRVFMIAREMWDAGFHHDATELANRHRHAEALYSHFAMSLYRSNDIEESLTFVARIDNLILLTELVIRHAVRFAHNGMYDKADKMVDDILEKAYSSTDIHEISAFNSVCVDRLVRTMLKIGMDDKSKKVVAKFLESAHPDTWDFPLSVISRAFASFGDKEEALNLFEKIPSPYYRGSTGKKLAIIFARLGHADIAAHLFEQCEEIARQLNTPFDQFKMLRSISFVKWKYFHANQHDLFHLVEKMYKLIESIESPKEIRIAHKNLKRLERRIDP